MVASRQARFALRERACRRIFQQSAKHLQIEDAIDDMGRQGPDREVHRRAVALAGRSVAGYTQRDSWTRSLKLMTISITSSV